MSSNNVKMVMGVRLLALTFGFFAVLSTEGLVRAEDPDNPAANAASPETTTDTATADAVEVTDYDLRALLNLGVGEMGGFAQPLRSLDVIPYVHGYATWFARDNDVNRAKDRLTFSSHYFNLIVGVDFKDRVAVEMMLEEEHGGDEQALRYGYIDTTVVKDALILRVGKFLTPMGVFNEYVYPEYINELPDRPLVLWAVVPVSWAEVGAQLRGKLEWSEGNNFNYAVYLANGLMQKDADGADGVIDDGGSIRDMKNHNRDYLGDDKAFGGRLGVSLFGTVSLGISGYSGAYTVDDEQRLSIADIDLTIDIDKFTFRSEFIKAWQETQNGSISKAGYFVRLSYRTMPELQLVAQFDQADLGEVNDGRATGALVLTPFPTVVSRFNFKLAYARTLSFGDVDPANPNEIVLQTAIGF